MFVEAIDTAATFTRAIHFISRNYGSDTVHPGAATLFFVNPDGWALTCRHLASQLQAAGQVMTNYQAFKGELAALQGKKREKALRREVEGKYKFSKQTTVELRNRFIDCVRGTLKVEALLHGSGTVWDLAAHPADSDFLLASTVNGQVFCTADGGDSWTKFKRDFGEVHALAWVPN